MSSGTIYTGYHIVIYSYLKRKVGRDLVICKVEQLLFLWPFYRLLIGWCLSHSGISVLLMWLRCRIGSSCLGMALRQLMWHFICLPRLRQRITGLCFCAFQKPLVFHNYLLHMYNTTSTQFFSSQHKDKQIFHTATFFINDIKTPRSSRSLYAYGCRAYRNVHYSLMSPCYHSLLSKVASLSVHLFLTCVDQSGPLHWSLPAGCS